MVKLAGCPYLNYWNCQLFSYDVVDVEERSSITPKMYLFLGIPAVVPFNSMRISLRCNITIIIKCQRRMQECQ